MARTAYWFCFFAVCLSALGRLTAWLIYLVTNGSPNLILSLSIFSFDSLVPPMLSGLVPGLVKLMLGGGMLFLIFRRIWLFFSKKERVPPSFQGFPKVLGYIGAISFVVSVAAFALTMALRGGSGVPAALLMLPALICVPWSFFLTEIFSFRRPAQS
ncbi:MAG: hypothetical protein IPH39_10700 [Sulfuritalea sp.]|jgi:hypothetical protein|nr:hypothetical protein [Sulfuritalea sp.]